MSMFHWLLQRVRLTVLFSLVFISLLAQSDKSEVKIIEKPNSSTIEIRNGLLGIVVPKQSAFDGKNGKPVLAPVQSIIYRDGTYSDDTPNFLQCEVQPTSVKMSIQTKTSSECTIVIRYNFNKPKFKYYDGNYKGGDAGSGYYQTTITVKKGSKTVIFDEDSDYDVWYEVKTNTGLNPDKARYRGWSSLSIENGYEPNGTIYRDENVREPLDATIDINYSKEKMLPFLSLWDPTGGEINSGRYWQFFNSQAPSTANLLGLFQGRPSKMIGATQSGVKVVIMPVGTQVAREDHTEKNTVSLQMIMIRRGPDNVWFKRKRLEWCLFISTKADLAPPAQYQPIGKEMNYVSGLASRIDNYASKPAQIMPAFFDASFYMPANKIQELIKKIKSDDAFYNKMIAIDPYFKPIADLWKNPGTAPATIKTMLGFAEEIKDTYKNKDGIHAIKLKYWMGSFLYKKTALQIACMFADKTITVSAGDKEKLMQLIRMMARIQWDDDNVPFYDSSGINFGPANMYFQYNNNGRNFFAMLFAKDPEFASRAKNILGDTRKTLLGVIYENGSSIGSPHYTQATIDPILCSMLQLKQAGIGDLFKEQKSRLNKFVDFYSALLTTPSVRFSNYRKLISFGDGSEESAMTFGLLANGLQEVDPSLSERLYNIMEKGAPRLSLFVEVVLAVDLEKTYPENFKTATANYTGYLSHFRSGVNTNNETAAWILNGEGYFDHRNNDRGEIAIYALKAPLSLSRSSFYYPRAEDPRIRSVVIPENEFPQWKTANQPITSKNTGGGEVWSESEQLEFAKLGASMVSTSLLKAKNKEWNRRVMMLTLQEDQPVIVFYDSVNNNKANIWSMLFMSQGAIKTSAGNITPADRIFDHNNPALQQLPEATEEKTVAKGLNKFTFNGQTWPQKTHATGGINWDMYTVSDNSTSFTAAQWTTTFQNSQEIAEFINTNGRGYSEMQQILRVKSNAPFFHVLLPYFKGTDPYKNNVQLIAKDKLQIGYAKGFLLVGANYFFYTGADKTVAGSFTPVGFNEKGIGITGGIAEITISGNDVKIRIHGNTGKRMINLPFEIAAIAGNNAVKTNNKSGSSQIIIDYTSKGLDLLSTEQGFTEYSFKKK